MPTELERRLEGFLAELPEPEPEVGERAQAAAVGAIHPAAPARRGLRSAIVVLAAAFVLLAIAAGSLAAAGALHVHFGASRHARPLVKTLQLPTGAAGIAAVVDGRLSVVTKSGFRLQGLRVSTADLSPHALFVAAGIGDSLVALAPDGAKAWRHSAGGPVVAIAWAPFGNRIAYIVHAGRRYVLHVIWGNGTNDAVIDRSVRAVRPSWRADSLAFAYVGAGGRAVVYDVGHQSRALVPVRAPVAGVAFAPTGSRLAVEGGDGLWLAWRKFAVRVPVRAVEAFGWQRARLVVAVSGLDHAVVRLFTSGGAPRGSYREQGIVLAVAPRVVVRQPRRLVTGGRTLLTVPRGTRVRDLQIG